MKTTKLRRASLGAATMIVVVSGVGAAMATSSVNAPANEAAILASAKVTLSQAIAAAESVTGGKAVGVGIEDQNGDVHFDVTILKGNASQSVLVDPQTGVVAKVVAENGDTDGEGAEGARGVEGGPEDGVENPAK